MALPLFLDPRTLRWLADEKDQERRRLLVEASEFRRRVAEQQDPDGWMAGAATHNEARARLHKREAQWLRAAATRVERRRARGGR